MQAEGKESMPLWQSAVDDARQLGRAYPKSTRFRLLGHGKSVLIPAAYQAKLDELKLGAQKLPRMDELGAEQAAANALYILSDFQKSQVDATSIGKLGQSREIVLVPKVARAVGNVYVDSVWLSDAFVRRKTNMPLHIRLRNGGSKVVNDCPVKVFLGKRQVAAFRATVEPGKAMAAVVQIQVEAETTELGRVMTEDSPLTFDNTYHFTLQPAAAIAVLEIGNEPTAEALYRNEPLFSYSFAKMQGLNYGALRKANLVLVNGLPQLDAGLQDGLQDVVKRGGSVVIVPPAASNGRSSYQALFTKLGLGTVQWEKAAAGSPELREVAMPSAQEPFFRDVFGAQQRAVTMPKAAPVLRWSRTGTDILRMKDGESYLAAFPSSAGRVYVFSAPLLKEYADFTNHALFVPVMYRMAMLSYRNEQQPAYRLSQAMVLLDLPGPANPAGEPNDAASIRLVKDSLVLIPGQKVQGQQAKLELPAGMNVPGFYEVRQNGKLLTTLAFNQDKRESELSAYSAEELRQQIAPEQKNIRVLEADPGGAGVAQLGLQQSGVPLWRYFLLLTLLCLLAEAALIRFGKKARPKQQAVAA
ncbi:hypothetical protein GCM10023185_34110 [Hymenobacter saemangeumensis]|uniref:Uncharacterized protein n=2 Tax=Hymenobacter saemangeumensis TaxID=1084522 RepID=A0ABP8INT5_9BACT